MTRRSRISALTLLIGLALAVPLDAARAVMPVPATHACAGQAADLARTHLERRAGGGERVTILLDGIRTRGAVEAPDGKGWLDTIEVPGTIAGRAFRVRLLYAQGDNTCAVRGEEVREGE